MTGATVRSVTVTLKGVSHRNGNEIAVMVAKDTKNTILMGGAGGFNVVDDATLIFDDTAESVLPQTSALVSGRFQPTNYFNPPVLPVLFTPPAPPVSGNLLLSTFAGIDPNGSWRLYVVDTTLAVDGTVSGGWQLTITADVPAKRKKRKKKR